LQWRKLLGLRNELRNHQLGYDGERYVASELDAFREHGFRIFHDFVFDMKPGGDASTFNIDHIVIGPPGVFAIETKTKRKSKEHNESDQPNHEMGYDGVTLILPGGFHDTDSINQALNASEDLSDWLTGSGELIPVAPVVVIPGWMVNRKAPGVVKVLSGKELASGIRELRPGKLTNEQLRLVADKIENHCRNIDSV
jgi:hypothetical protein